MKTFLLSLAGAFAAIVLFWVIAFFLLMGLIGAASAGDKAPDQVVLTLNLNTPYSDQAQTTGFAAFSEEPGFIDILTRLKAAETDERVKGIYVRGADVGIGSSNAEELREAFRQFRDSGKFIIAHSQGTFGISGPSALRSISAADELWIQPGSDLFSTGVSFETEFYNGLLNKIDVKSEIYPFYEYKNAANSYNEESYTEPHREAMLSLAESLWTASLDDIAEDRGMSVAALRAALEGGPLPSDKAVSAKLFDKLGWPEDARKAAEERGGADAEFVDISDYDVPIVPFKNPAIAIVGGEGAVVTGNGSGGSPFAAPVGFASDNVAQAILDAGRDERVKAVVFRVDSPGGSPIASDQIWNAVERVQEMGKPVVVSMGSLAASGGYYVSAGADKIVANRSTITGSIGIFGGKFAIEGGFNNLGITFDNVSVGGDFADAYGVDPFTPEQEAEVKAWLKRGYDRFLNIVGEGRDMTYDEVHAIARGRVWSGADAKERGLVDELGTFTDAIRIAGELAELDADVTPRLVYFPRRKTGFEALEEAFGVSAEAATAATMLGALAGDERLNAIVEEMAFIEAVNEGQMQARALPIRER